jgi:hypothetical protein
MYHVRQESLPFVASSHEFVGAEQGDTSVSVFLFHGKPGSGPGPPGIFRACNKTSPQQTSQLTNRPLSEIIAGERPECDH